jgi:MFS family permease
MNADLPSPGQASPTRVRYGVLGFACTLSMITYLDRVCFGTVAPNIQHEFHLSDSHKGMLFTAFALAYSLFEVPTGWLGDLFGARRTLVRIVIWWSVFTALTGAVWPTPFWPGLGFLLLLGVRFLFGVGEAGAYPNISRAFANWFPFGERGSAQGAVWMAGRLAGGLAPMAVNVLVFFVLGAANWRQTFWVFGGLGVVWCVFFWWWFRDRPEEHPAVNPAELALIRGVRPAAAAVNGAARPTYARADVHARSAAVLAGPAVVGMAEPPSSPPPEPVPHAEHSHRDVPWGKLAADPNLWTLCLMYFCGSFGWYFNITWLPGYLSNQYGVTAERYGVWVIGLLAGAPLLLGSLACLGGGLLTDWFVRVTGNRRWGRRLFGMIGHGLCAVCYFLTLTAGGSPWLFVLFVALAAFWNDLTMGATWASAIDIGGKYPGIVSGCMNTIGNLGGAVAGLTTGFMLDHFGRETGWTVNLVSYGVVYVVAVFLWLRFDATRTVAQA